MKTTIKIRENGIHFEDIEPGTVFNIPGDPSKVYIKTVYMNVSIDGRDYYCNTISMNTGYPLFFKDDISVKVYEEVECR